MKLSIESKYWVTVRKDIISCAFLSIYARIILNHLVVFQKNPNRYAYREHLSKEYGFTESIVDEAFDELKRVGLIEYKRELYYSDTKVKYWYELLPKINDCFIGALYGGVRPVSPN